MTDTKNIKDPDVSCYGLMCTRSILTLTNRLPGRRSEECVPERYVGKVKIPPTIYAQRAHSSYNSLPFKPI